jgi:hypothetical protein
MNTIIVATQILMNDRNPIRHFFTNSRIQDEYAMRKGTPSPIFIDKFAELGVDKEIGDSTQLQPGPIDDRRGLFTNHQKSQHRTNFRGMKVFTDGSLKDERVG